MADNKLISHITLPSGTYDIKDEWARGAISGLTGAAIFKGVSTTPITDGGNERPTIGGTQLTPENGWVVIYGNSEFVYSTADTSSWHEFGSTSHLGAFATANSGSTSYTPTGNIGSSFNGDASFESLDNFVTGVTLTGTRTIDGSKFTYTKQEIDTHTFSGTSFTSSGSYTPKGSITGTPTYTANVTGTTYTPKGNIVKGTEVSISNITPTASLDTAPTFTGTDATIDVTGTANGDVTVNYGSEDSTKTATLTGASCIPNGSIDVVLNNGNITNTGATATTDVTQTQNVVVPFNQTAVTFSGVTAIQNNVLTQATYTESTETITFFAGTQSASSVTAVGQANIGTITQPAFTATTTVTKIEGKSNTSVASKGFTGSTTNITGGSVTLPKLTGSFSDALVTASGSYTPAGNISKPNVTVGTIDFSNKITQPTFTFAGSGVTITPTVKVGVKGSDFGFSGSADTVSVTGTATGNITVTLKDATGTTKCGGTASISTEILDVSAPTKKVSGNVTLPTITSTFTGATTDIIVTPKLS